MKKATTKYAYYIIKNGIIISRHRTYETAFKASKKTGGFIREYYTDLDQYFK